MSSSHNRRILDMETGEPRYETEHEAYQRRQNRGKTAVWNPRFIALDGEGITGSDAIHRYIYLAAYDGTEFYERQNLGGLMTFECLDFLCELPQRKQHHVVCYGASYDINMMLCDLSKKQITKLWSDSTHTIVLGEGRSFYKVQYVPRKLLRVWRWIDKKPNGSCCIYDVLGFFQTPFVRALDEWLGKEYTDTENITAMKAKRGEFQDTQIGSIATYCKQELVGLHRLMNVFTDSLKAADIHVKSWIGAGAIAGALLAKEQISSKRRNTFEHEPWVYSWARRAYFGGRIELLQYGTYRGRLYHYDLNSAYVSALPLLPDLSNGKWRYYRPLSGRESINRDALDDPQSFAMFQVRWRPSASGQKIGPFPFRNRRGYVYYPTSGEGIYWAPEVFAALNHWQGEISILGMCSWDGNSERPFEFVRTAYATRAQWKHDKNPAHIPLKLGLNSIYGKLIQGVGADETKRKLPPYHQLEWAGFITSYVRAKLYTAALLNPDAIISLQTDGIISTEPLELPISQSLGDWSREADSYWGCFVQSGVYWLAEEGEEKPETLRAFYRGFDKGSLNAGRIIDAWKAGEREVTARSTRFVGMGSGVASKNGWEHWRTWRTINRQLALYPDKTKRQTIADDRGQPWRGLVRTEPQDLFYGSWEGSQPYRLPWDSWKQRETIDGVKIDEYDAETED